MPPQAKLLWINKSARSKSLSNSKYDEEDRIINSHVQTITQQKLRPKPAGLSKQRTLKSSRSASSPPPLEDLSISSTSAGSSCFKVIEDGVIDDYQPDNADESGSNTWQRRIPIEEESPYTKQLTKPGILSTIPTVPSPSAHLDPFSSFSVKLNSGAFRHLLYFKTIWSQAAFKSPTYANEEYAIDQNEVIKLVQNCLTDDLTFHSMLAAVAGRMQVVHSVCRERGEHSPEQYAARALQILRQRLQNNSKITDQLALDILFLSAYELYCDNHSGTRQHLKALSILHKDKFESKYAQALCRNIDLFVATASLTRPVFPAAASTSLSTGPPPEFDDIRRSSLNNITGLAFFLHVGLFDSEMLAIIEQIIECAKVAEDCRQHIVNHPGNKCAEISRLAPLLIQWSEDLSYHLVCQLNHPEDDSIKTREQLIVECSIIVILIWLSYLPVGMMSMAEQPRADEDNWKMIQGRGSALVRRLRALNIFETERSAFESELFLWIFAGGIVMAVDADDVEWCCLALIRMAEEVGITTREEMSDLFSRYLWLDKFEIVDYQVLAGLLNPDTRTQALSTATGLANKTHVEKRIPTRVTNRPSNRYRLGA